MSTELESLLPTKYITRWKQRIKKSKFEFCLKIDLPFRLGWSFDTVANLQRLLSEHKIPIEDITSTDYSWWFIGVTYSGNSKEIGQYKLTSKDLNSVHQERITLKVSKDGKEVGKTGDLLKIINEYIALREQQGRLDCKSKEE